MAVYSAHLRLRLAILSVVLFGANTLGPQSALGAVQESPAPSGEQRTSAAKVPELAEILDVLANPRIREKEGYIASLTEYLDRADEFVEPLADILIVKNEQNEAAARSILFLLGERALPSIEKFFHPERQSTAGDNELWRKACSAIHAVGEPARATFEDRLLKILDESTDPNVRVPVIYALTGLDGGSPRAIEKVIIDLDQPDFNATLTVLRLIIKTGPEARGALERVQKMFVEGNLNQRTWSGIALAVIGPPAGHNPYADLRPLLDEFFLVKRERSLQAIGKLGAAGADAEPRVREMMADVNSNTEALASFVLWQITGNAADAIARLKETANTTELEVQSLQLLGEMGVEGSDAIPFLIDKSRSHDGSIVALCVEALASIDYQNEAVKARFAELESHPDPLVRLALRLAEARHAR